MGLFEGLQNLFRGIAEGRSNDSGMFPGLPSIGLDETDGPFRFAVADDQMQVDMIWNLLTEQIGERRNKHLPKPLPDPDDLFRPVLVGAWAEDRLVGGVSVICLSSCCVDYGFMLVTLKLFVISRSHLSVVGL